MPFSKPLRNVADARILKPLISVIRETHHHGLTRRKADTHDEKNYTRHVRGEACVRRPNLGAHSIAACGLMLINASCTKTPESHPLTSKPGYYPLSSLRVDSQTWNCQQLANEADLLKDAVAVALEQRSDKHVVHLKAETEAVQRARTLKKCNV
jgi:hypothetical protein